MKRVGLPVFVLLLPVLAWRFFVMGAAQDSVDGRLKSLLPSDVLGWKAEPKDAVYDRESIFEYIDGAGEVYRAYNFRRLLSRRFVKDGQPDLTADVFDMGASYDAFGVFSNDLEGDEAGLGQGSTYNGGLLAFWKDRFFVSLSADRETEEAKAALFALGRSVDASIKEHGSKPPLLSLLPSEFAAAKAVRYLHSHILLNRHFFISHDDILNLSRAEGAVLSKPGKKGEAGVLLLVEYPTPGTASDAYAGFSRIYMPGAKEPGSVQAEDKTWTAASLQGRLIAVVFQARSAAAAKDVLNRVKSGLK